MQNPSFDSVSVSFLDRELVLRELEHCAAALRRSNTHVKRVILFGSLVQGNHGPGSDADLLIVLSSDDRRSIDRIPEYLQAFSDVQIAVDVFPLTERELERALNAENAFLREAIETGKDLVGSHTPYPSGLLR